MIRIPFNYATLLLLCTVTTLAGMNPRERGEGETGSTLGSPMKVEGSTPPRPRHGQSANRQRAVSVLAKSHESNGSSGSTRGSTSTPGSNQSEPTTPQRASHRKKRIRTPEPQEPKISSWGLRPRNLADSVGSETRSIAAQAGLLSETPPTGHKGLRVKDVVTGPGAQFSPVDKPESPAKLQKRNDERPRSEQKKSTQARLELGDGQRPGTSWGERPPFKHAATEGSIIGGTEDVEITQACRVGDGGHTPRRLSPRVLFTPSPHHPEIAVPTEDALKSLEKCGRKGTGSDAPGMDVETEGSQTHGSVTVYSYDGPQLRGVMEEAGSFTIGSDGDVRDEIDSPPTNAQESSASTVIHLSASTEGASNSTLSQPSPPNVVPQLDLSHVTQDMAASGAASGAAPRVEATNYETLTRTMKIIQHMTDDTTWNKAVKESTAEIEAGNIKNQNFNLQLLAIDNEIKKDQPGGPINWEQVQQYYCFDLQWPGKTIRKFGGRLERILRREVPENENVNQAPLLNPQPERNKEIDLMLSELEESRSLAQDIEAHRSDLKRLQNPNLSDEQIVNAILELPVTVKGAALNPAKNKEIDGLISQLSEQYHLVRKSNTVIFDFNQFSELQKRETAQLLADPHAADFESSRLLYVSKWGTALLDYINALPEKDKEEASELLRNPRMADRKPTRPTYVIQPGTDLLDYINALPEKDQEQAETLLKNAGDNSSIKRFIKSTTQDETLQVAQKLRQVALDIDDYYYAIRHIKNESLFSPGLDRYIHRLPITLKDPILDLESMRHRNSNNLTTEQVYAIQVYTAELAEWDTQAAREKAEEQRIAEIYQYGPEAISGILSNIEQASSRREVEETINELPELLKERFLKLRNVRYSSPKSDKQPHNVARSRRTAAVKRLSQILPLDRQRQYATELREYIRDELNYEASRRTGLLERLTHIEDAVSNLEQLEQSLAQASNNSETDLSELQEQVEQARHGAARRLTWLPVSLRRPFLGLRERVPALDSTRSDFLAQQKCQVASLKQEIMHRTQNPIRKIDDQLLQEVAEAALTEGA